MTIDMQVSGLLTLILSSGGVFSAISAWYFIHHTGRRVGKSIANYLLIQAAFLSLTMLFGLAALIGAPHWFWHTLYYCRVPILLADVIALFSLARTFYDITNDSEA